MYCKAISCVKCCVELDFWHLLKQDVCLLTIHVSKQMTQDSRSVIELLKLIVVSFRPNKEARESLYNDIWRKVCQRCWEGPPLVWKFYICHYWFCDKVLRYLGTCLVALCFGLGSLYKVFVFFFFIKPNKTSKKIPKPTSFLFILLISVSKYFHPFYPQVF